MGVVTVAFFYDCFSLDSLILNKKMKERFFFCFSFFFLCLMIFFQTRGTFFVIFSPSPSLYHFFTFRHFEFIFCIQYPESDYYFLSINLFECNLQLPFQILIYIRVDIKNIIKITIILSKCDINSYSCVFFIPIIS